LTETPILSADDPVAVAEAARCLRAGGLVAFPTETVYGLGADATSSAAVARIFAAKARPRFNPLIVHLPDIEAARRIADLPGPAEILAEALWPGALTLVAPLRSDAGLVDLVTAGLESVALRIPAHPIARALLAEAGVPVAAPSANPSGQVSPTTAAHVAEGLAGKLDLILDGGPCPVGLESTIVGFAGGRPVLLRAGGIARADIEALVGPLGVHAPEEGINAPGQLARHYAPRTRLRLNAMEVGDGEALIAFGPEVPKGAARTINLSQTGDLAEAAANLFAALRQLDGLGLETIAVMPIPAHGLGEAINDRLKRAAS